MHEQNNVVTNSIFKDSLINLLFVVDSLFLDIICTYQKDRIIRMQEIKIWHIMPYNTST